LLIPTECAVRFFEHSVSRLRLFAATHVDKRIADSPQLQEELS